MPSFTHLKKSPPANLKKELSPTRINNYHINHPLLEFNFASSLVSEVIIKKLQTICDSANVIQNYEHILAGEKCNVFENQAIHHHFTRLNKAPYNLYQKNADSFSKSVHDHTICSSSHQPFTDVIQVGIGGSNLGPKVLIQALSASHSQVLTPHFMSNIDPVCHLKTLGTLNPKTTLVIVVSKSGSTQETLQNLALIKQWFLDHKINEKDTQKHLLAVTCPNSLLDDKKIFRNVFYITPEIGGRYSWSSVVGGLLISLIYTPQAMNSLLKGASKYDNQATQKSLLKNASLCAAAIGIYERNVLEFDAKAIIPYSDALAPIHSYIQQLDCESNGKHSDKSDKYILYQTSPVIFGAPGTNAQHSFFQMLHQGTSVIPIQFIAVKDQTYTNKIATENHQKANHHLSAQIAALAQGKSHHSPNEHFKGNRPSTLLILPNLNAESIGALMAFYENMVMFQGFLWNINSFDQSGVKLGKELAKKIEEKNTDPLLQAIRNLLTQ